MTSATPWLRSHPTALSGLSVVERGLREDPRGAFSRVFCADEIGAADTDSAFPVKQINHSSTLRAGSVRGLHFQHPPFGERKLVSCLRGAVFDVAVDLRRGSPTLLRWHGEILSRQNRRALLIPEGFAHGFQTLEDETELLYLHSKAFAAEAEDGVDPCDPAIAIEWPLPFADISERDRRHPRLGGAYGGI